MIAPTHDVLQRIASAQAIPVLRSADPETALEDARILSQGGLSVVEVTFSIPDVEQVIKELSSWPGLTIGAGTVLHPAQATAALEAGADFLVSPIYDRWLINEGRRGGFLAVPGCATPTEIFKARQDGAELIKVFPIARLGGARYIKDLLAPMPELRLMATGGVRASDVTDLISAGCSAVGIGSILTDAGLGSDPVARVKAFVSARLQAPSQS
ncbi:2-dehydro-3-deoxyphosphogluconate aldolase/(4S)-4-hydroxy-2-oxoglutarate aldolase [Arthrobacter pascens]|uniref:bifunctional 4-hydroxy-2-oxoglutarate aldolase/2-dehydro-3-deoxy-phosphogluconate aldolase n=1 Tax=Arthrobacter pascens TaxID=1677 RepID=UPI00285A38C1|nr:bifunctional 4-hydroxy-2-oxoglutarate aldolase/2-dehydro-3-deoxy-phosphogluconate aldolase [Arthrobacter pascens]MDR6557674.1 2-dehydro-3-deoxyphosphogluconate aldolase/(4S)-4-hydroxy-2-oxoglutarate aldolase [Arthrobacter pascens]